MWVPSASVVKRTKPAWPCMHAVHNHDSRGLGGSLPLLPLAITTGNTRPPQFAWRHAWNLCIKATVRPTQQLGTALNRVKELYAPSRPHRALARACADCRVLCCAHGGNSPSVPHPAQRA